MMSFQMRPSSTRFEYFWRLSIFLKTRVLRLMQFHYERWHWRWKTFLASHTVHLYTNTKRQCLSENNNNGRQDRKKKEIGEIDGQSAPKLRTWLPMATPGRACDADRCGHWKKRRNEIDRNEINQIDLPALGQAFPRPRSTYFTVAAIFLVGRTLSSFCANHNKIWRALGSPFHPQRQLKPFKRSKTSEIDQIYVKTSSLGDLGLIGR